MSNFFYTSVDANLRKELDARGRAGMKRRTNEDFDFMLGKIANVEIIAYANSSSLDSDQIAVLGGASVRGERFQPSGKNGFLSNPEYTKPIVEYYKDASDSSFIINNAAAVITKSAPPRVGYAYNSKKTLNDDSRRVAPYITGVDVSVGDHSMALLNKATVSFVIPNVERDLDDIEAIWFRPGRFCKIRIVHPDEAIVSRQETNGQLQPKTLPSPERLKSLYGDDWPIDDFLKQVGKMNEFTFEGLITSFDFSFNEDGSVSATLSLSGRSAVYADVSMLVKTPQQEQKTEIQKSTVNLDPILGTPVITTPPPPPPPPFGPAEQGNVQPLLPVIVDPNEIAIAETRKSFYGDLYENFELISQNLLNGTNLMSQSIFIAPFPSRDPNKTDRWILKGSPYDTTVTLPNQLLQKAGTGNTTKSIPAQTQRYVTLGVIIDHVNKIVRQKIGNDKSVFIKFDDILCFSNYHANLVSCIPEDILLLPEKYDVLGDMNSYGSLTFYKKIDKDFGGSRPWPGVYNNDPKVIYPSRIFVNLQMIKKIVDDLTIKTSTFKMKTFVTAVCQRIMFATGGAINLNLISHPDDINQFILADNKFTQTVNVQGTQFNQNNKDTTIQPYSIPMFSNHPAGSIIHSFNMSAKLPTSAKNLAFVLNTSTEISESELAPYLNFMYNSGNGNAEQINKLIDKFKEKYESAQQQLTAAKSAYGKSPGMIQDVIEPLRNALLEYMKYPTIDISTSQQLIAPMFPFEADFTIDGINGLRFGDVVIFECLPTRYRINTVFSIGSITHNVDTTGKWTTNVKCFMRAQIDT